MVNFNLSILGRGPAVCLALLCCGMPVHAQKMDDVTSATVAKTTAKEEKNEPKYGVGKPMGDVYVDSTPVPTEKSRLVVYRLPNAKQQSVITVYINGSYHTSLMQAGFSKICMADTNFQMRLRLRPVNQPVNIELDQSTALNVAKGQTQYIRVAELSDGRTQMDTVTATVAANELKKTREQMHALSRVEGGSSCGDNKSAQAPDGIVLVTYIEFARGRSRLIDMGPSDLFELDRLIEKFKALGPNQSLMRVQVAGYANDGSSKTSNKQLAESRVKVVEDYLRSQGIKPKALVTEVRADSISATAENSNNSVVIVTATVEQP